MTLLNTIINKQQKQQEEKTKEKRILQNCVGDVETLINRITYAFESETIRLCGYTSFNLSSSGLVLRRNDVTLICSTISCVLDGSSLPSNERILTVIGSNLQVDGLTFMNSKVSSSFGPADGGAVNVSGGGTHVFRNCLFNGNEARDGGGIYSQDIIQLENCAFTNNKAKRNGGAVSAYNVIIPTFSSTGNIVGVYGRRNNKAGRQCDMAYLDQSSLCIGFQDGSLPVISPDGSGGGSNRSPSPFYNSPSPSPSPMYYPTSPSYFSQSPFPHNGSPSPFDNRFNCAGTYDVLSSRIRNAYDGEYLNVCPGTIYVGEDMYLSADGVTISCIGTDYSCVLSKIGGGGRGRILNIDIENNGGTGAVVGVSLHGLTFENGNVIYGSGGAIRMSGRGNKRIENCLFRNNRANSGGAIYSEGGTTTIQNSIFEKNTGRRGGAVNADSIVDSYGNSGFGNTATQCGGIFHRTTLFCSALNTNPPPVPAPFFVPPPSSVDPPTSRTCISNYEVLQRVVSNARNRDIISLCENTNFVVKRNDGALILTANRVTLRCNGESNSCLFLYEDTNRNTNNNGNVDSGGRILIVRGNHVTIDGIAFQNGGNTNSDNVSSSPFWGISIDDGARNIDGHSYEGLQDHACRYDDSGNNNNNNNGQYYDVIAVSTLRDCQQRCSERGYTCRGVQYRSTSGNCQLWKVQIGYMEPINNTQNPFSCYQKVLVRHGGAVAITGGGDITIRECTFRNNWARGHGGGLYISNPSSSVFLSFCEFNQNRADGIDNQSNGGGLAIVSANDVSLQNVDFDFNTADGIGGGFYINEVRTQISIVGGIIAENEARRGGGGAVLESRNVGIEGTFFESNRAESNFGGLVISNTNSEIRNCEFRKNFAKNNSGGAAILGGNSYRSTVTGALFDNNEAQNAFAGGLRITISNAIVKDSIFCYNRASYGGGGARLPFRIGGSNRGHGNFVTNNNNDTDDNNNNDNNCNDYWETSFSGVGSSSSSSSLSFCRTFTVDTNACSDGYVVHSSGHVFQQWIISNPSATSLLTGRQIVGEGGNGGTTNNNNAVEKKKKKKTTLMMLNDLDLIERERIIHFLELHIQEVVENSISNGEGGVIGGDGDDSSSSSSSSSIVRSVYLRISGLDVIVEENDNNDDNGIIRSSSSGGSSGGGGGVGNHTKITSTTATKRGCKARQHFSAKVTFNGLPKINKGMIIEREQQQEQQSLKGIIMNNNNNNNGHDEYQQQEDKQLSDNNNNNEDYNNNNNNNLVLLCSKELDNILMKSFQDENGIKFMNYLNSLGSEEDGGGGGGGRGGKSKVYEFGIQSSTTGVVGSSYINNDNNILLYDDNDNDKDEEASLSFSSSSSFHDNDIIYENNNINGGMEVASMYGSNSNNLAITHYSDNNNELALSSGGLYGEDITFSSPPLLSQSTSTTSLDGYYGGGGSGVVLANSHVKKKNENISGGNNDDNNHDTTNDMNNMTSSTKSILGLGIVVLIIMIFSFIFLLFLNRKKQQKQQSQQQSQQ